MEVHLSNNTADQIELLSPAGNPECFYAAINAGADAVYAGGIKFGARAYAGNFSDDELKEAIDHAHLFGKRFYLTVNTILKNNEVSELYDYIAPLYEAGLDGVIVQDIGVISYLTRIFPELPLHASTQMAITDVDGVRFLKDMGIKRVVPARELSLKEINRIYEETGMELECFIHGALCYSYSGKCLFSSILGGRSGNRGRCAQPCRLPYNESYILSARDILTLDILPELIGAGISSFKIEGRMKSKEYVAGVTGIYRKYIDRYFNSGKDYTVEDSDMNELEDLYTRSGHCEGYYHIHNGRQMITLDKPSYNTASDDRLNSMFDKYAGNDLKKQIGCEINAFIGKPLKLKFSCAGYSVSYEGNIVEACKTKPTDRADIIKHTDKLGGTSFKFSDIRINCDDGIFIPVSSINQARREAVALLREKMLKSARREHKTAVEVTQKRAKEKRSTGEGRFVNCRIDRLHMLERVLNRDYIDIVTLAIDEINADNIDSVVQKVHDCGKKIFFALSTMIRNGYLERIPSLSIILKEGMADGMVTDNYEALYYLKKIGFKGVIISDIHLYAANDNAVSAYFDSGVDVITFPVELNARELKDLKLESGEFILYGRLPMMVSAQCVMKTRDKCVHDNGVSYIRDRYGNSFPCVRNCSECYNTILNCVPTMITSIKDIQETLKPYSYRLHFTIEDKDEIDRILSIYDDVFALKSVKDPGIKHTLGHLKRGVE